MGNIEHTCPDCGDPGFINPTTARWQCGNDRCENTDEVEVGALTVEQQLAGAVEALQAIYDRHHMVGDGSAGQVSGDALRALGIDPDAGGQ